MGRGAVPLRRQVALGTLRKQHHVRRHGKSSPELASQAYAGHRVPLRPGGSRQPREPQDDQKHDQSPPGLQTNGNPLTTNSVPLLNLAGGRRPPGPPQKTKLAPNSVTTAP